MVKNAEYDIAVYEAIAVIAALRRFPKKMRQFFQLAIGVDNTSTLFALAKAMSKNLALAVATSILLDEFDDLTLLFYVPSKMNIADIFTRDERISELDDRLFCEKVRNNDDDLKPIFRQIETRTKDVRKYFAYDAPSTKRQQTNGTNSGGCHAPQKKKLKTDSQSPA